MGTLAPAMEEVGISSTNHLGDCHGWTLPESIAVAGRARDRCCTRPARRHTSSEAERVTQANRGRPIDGHKVQPL